MRRCLACGVFLALLPACTAATAVPVRFEAALASAAGSETRLATLKLVPQDPAQQPISVSLPVPGEAEVEIASGTTWQVSAESPDLWSAPSWIAADPAGIERRVVLRFFPAATVTGLLEPRGNVPPAIVDLRLEASPGVPSPKPQPTPMQCPVEGLRFRCRLPSSRLDLRIRAGAFIPIYLWDVQIPTGKVLDLGTLPLKKGASVVGWVRTDDSEEAAGASVRLEPQTMGAPADLGRALALKAVALESRTNARGFFQVEGVSPGTVVVTIERPGFVPVSRSGIEVRPDLEAQILDPLVLARPLAVQVTLDPPSAPSGATWTLALEKKADVEGLQGQVLRGEASVEGIWRHEGLGAGKYSLLLADGDLRWTFDGLEIAPGHTDLQVTVPALRVQGRVRLGDEPLAATLWLGGRSASRRARFVSDEKGRFEGILPEEGLWPVELVSEAEHLRVKLDPIEVQRSPWSRSAERSSSTSET